MSSWKALQERLVEREANVVCQRDCIKSKKFIKIDKEDEKDCIKFEEFIKINKEDEEDDWIDVAWTWTRLNWRDEFAETFESNSWRERLLNRVKVRKTVSKVEYR